MAGLVPAIPIVKRRWRPSLGRDLIKQVAPRRVCLRDESRFHARGQCFTATMAAALALALDQDGADVEPGKRGNQRDTLAQ
jgi:hypothetical protein